MYGFRLGEIVASTNSLALDGQPLQILGISANVREINSWMFLVFACTLLLTILLHTTRLVKVLVAKKSAYLLGVLVVLKILFVLFDIATNSFLLYEVLVFQQERLFVMNLITNLVLAVFAVSPALSLTTNALLNFPLHVTHLRMQLRDRQLPSGERGEQVGVVRVMRAAMRKTFHPVITWFFGLYTGFALFALSYILLQVYRLDYRTVVLNVPSTLLPGYVPVPGPAPNGTASNDGTAIPPGSSDPYLAWLNNAQERQDVLVTMLWLNVIGNYGIGVASSVLYWLAMVVAAAWTSLLSLSL